MSLSRGLLVDGISRDYSYKEPGGDWGPSLSPDGTLPPRPCQHLLPRHFVRASPAGTETGTSCHAIAMAVNEPRARLIKETSLMQERGEGGWREREREKNTAYAGLQPKQQK